MCCICMEVSKGVFFSWEEEVEREGAGEEEDGRAGRAMRTEDESRRSSNFVVARKC